MAKVRWGILSTAKIAREKVIPGMQASAYCDIAAIASRDIEQAKTEAARLHINKAYGSYEALLEDPDIDAVYIPLPNQLHVPWTIRAIQAGKHVLCEKPISLSAAEAAELLEAAASHPQLKVMEAFMYRFHPQWQYAKKMVDEGQIGSLKSIQSVFSYFNDDPNNIRNQKDAGGGGMMDIGCYCVSLSRFLFGHEPVSVLGTVETDPDFGTDRMASGILAFGDGTASFTCSTQLTPYQRVHILGTTGGIEIDIPFNAPVDASTSIWLHSKAGKQEVRFDPVNQYTIQGDLFSRAILENTAVPTPLTDAVDNMKVIEAIFKSSAEGSWQQL